MVSEGGAVMDEEGKVSPSPSGPVNDLLFARYQRSGAMGSRPVGDFFAAHRRGAGPPAAKMKTYMRWVSVVMFIVAGLARLRRKSARPGRIPNERID